MPFRGKSALVRGPWFEMEPDHLEIQDEIRSLDANQTNKNRDEKDATPSEKSIPYDWV